MGKKEKKQEQETGGGTASQDLLICGLARVSVFASATVITSIKDTQTNVGQLL